MPSKRRNNTGKFVAAGLGSIVALAGAAYVAGYAMAGENVPSNTTVNGVAVGGVAPERAVEKLREAMSAKAEAPIEVSQATPAKKATIKPTDAGMRIDYEATIEQAGAGRSWQPEHIWRVLRGGGEIKPVLERDATKLKAAVAAAAPTFATKGSDASVKIVDAKPVLSESTNSVALDVDKTAAAVDAAWLKTTKVEAVTTTTEPELTTAEAKKLVDETLAPTLSGPVTVKVGDKKLVLTTEQIAAATTVTAKDGAISAATDAKKLWAVVDKQQGTLGLGAPQNARITLSGGKPAVVPSKDGQALDQQKFLDAVPKALTASGTQRVVDVPVTKKEADLTTAEAQKLGVKEVTGEFTTYFPYAEYRNINLSLAAASINNSFVRPGEVFSLNNALGPKGPGSGYVDGWVISGDRMKKENAGGVSQSGTTVFNAGFFAGLEDVEHHPHTMYFERYPAGREATLYYGHLDVKFRNDTPYGVLLQSYVNKAAPGQKGSITVKVWSTKVYDKVESSELRKSNFTSGRTIHSKDPECHAQSPSQGFTVNYERLFYKGGKLVKTEPFKWTYSPTDEIICD